MRTAIALLMWLALTGTVSANPQSFAPEVADGMSADAQRQEAEKHLQNEPPDLDEARQWLESAAENGSVEAMGEVGWLYEQGLGVEPDSDRALTFYEQAYEAGENDYGIRIGWMYIQGFGLDPDRALGEAWFRRVIEDRDDSQARLALASVLIADAVSNVQPDPAPEVIELLTKALEDDLPVAAHYLARLHMEGLGTVPANPERAVHFTRIGADAGNPQMQGWMAMLHLRGEGVPQDLIEAHTWASLSAAGGDPAGEQIRRELASQLDRDDLMEARRRALDWLSR
jgi:TPR repeat protein